VNWKKAADGLPPVVTPTPDLNVPVRPQGFPPKTGLK